MSDFSRREFLRTASLAATAGAIAGTARGQQPGKAVPLGGPVVVSSANGLPATQKAAEMIQAIPGRCR